MSDEGEIQLVDEKFPKNFDYSGFALLPTVSIEFPENTRNYSTRE